MTIWCLAAAAVLVASAVQAMTGFGFSLTALPVLVLLYGARDAIALNLLLSATANLWVAWRSRADADPCLARALTLGGVLGVLPGVLVYYVASGRALTLGIGAILVCAALLRLSGAQFRVPISRPASISAGFVGGFIQGSIGLGGPPVSLYLSGSELRKAAYRGTIAVFFVLPNAINLPAHLFSLSSSSWARVGLASTVVLVIPLGAMIGQAAFVRLPQIAFERLVLIVIVLAAATAIYDGVIRRS